MIDLNRCEQWQKEYEELEALREAADVVLRNYMPMFPDSRAVDDCLVGLALARSPAQRVSKP